MPVGHREVVADDIDTTELEDRVTGGVQPEGAVGADSRDAGAQGVGEAGAGDGEIDPDRALHRGEDVVGLRTHSSRQRSEDAPDLS